MAFTKIVGAGIHTLSNVHTHNINSSGIITATQFVGPFDGSSGDFSGNVSIGGSLTVNGDFTTLNTTLREVELLRVDANSSAAAGIITQTGAGDLLRLYDGASQVVTVDDVGNVGLGSAVPGSLLNLASANPLIRLTDTDSNVHSAIGGESGFLYLYTNSSSRDFIFRGSQEVARLTGDGKLGIGTNVDETQKLTIHGESNYHAGIKLRQAGVSQFRIMAEGGTGNVYYDVYGVGGSANGDHIFRTKASTGSLQTMRINEDGKVGIGSEIPTKQFQVKDYTATSTTARDNTVARFLSNASNADCNIQLSNSVDHSAQIGIVGNGAEVYIAQDGIERLRIDSDGNVGIGTDNPKAQLEVYKVGTGVTATSVVRGEKAVFAIMGDKTNTNASETDARLVFSSDGDVSPSKILNSPLVNHGFEIALINEEPGSGLRFHDGTANEERLRINTDGRVGIGSTIPSGVLDLYHATSNTILNVKSGDSGSVINLIDNATRSSIEQNGRTLKIVSDTAGTYANSEIRLQVDGATKVDIDSSGQITNTGIETSFVTTMFAANFAKLDIRGTNIANSNHYILSYGEGHANNQEFHVVNTLDDLVFRTSSERLRIKADGKLFLHGTNASGTNNTSALLPAGHTFNIHGTGSNDGISVVRYSGSYGAYGINIGRSRNDTFGTNTAVQSGDELGHVTFYGADGTNFDYAAQITGLCDGAVGTGGDATDMPGALSFRTTPEGSDTPVERMKIRSGGQVAINESSGGSLELTRTSTNTSGLCGQIVFGNTDWDSSMASIKSYQDGGNDNASLRFYTQASVGAGEIERLRINKNGQVTTRGASGTMFNNVGNSDFGSFLVINGGHTTNQFGILSLEGNADGHGQGVGHIQFINQANGNGSSGNNVQARLIARIDSYTETSDTNANDDSGGTLRFFTKEEGVAPKERLTIKGNGRIGINETNPDRDLQVQNQVDVAQGGTIRLVNRSTSMNNGQIAGMIEFEQRDSNTPGVSATIRSEMQDTTNGNCMLAFQTGTPSTIGTRLIMHGAGTITVPQGPTQFPDGTTASALVNTSGRQPNSGNDFQTGGSGNKSIGWYTIAVSNGGRAWGRIGIRDTASSRHQAVTLFCGHHYGGDPNQNSIHAISSGRHSGNPIGAVRIRGYGTYDGAMLQVYLRDATNGCQAFLLGDNIQTHGWIMKDWIADGTDPGDLVNWSAINSNGYTSAYSDLNVLQHGGTSTDGHIIPGRDNVTHLGNPTYRFDDIYATNTTIQGSSDERLKQDIAALTTAEMNAAKRMSALFKTFRWKDRVLEKGDKARTHTGVIAQQVKAALEAEGLDPTKYGFYGFDEWYEDSEGTKLPIDTPARQGDSQDPTIENNIEGLGGSIVVPDGFEKKSLYSIRIGELLAFIAAYNEQRFTSIESRLTALESS